jgi:hypothetical protein
MMYDGDDFYDYFVLPLLDLDHSVLAKVADKAFGNPDWALFQNGPNDVADKVAQIIHDDYFDTGASDSWGPATYVNWYINSAYYDMNNLRSA